MTFDVRSLVERQGIEVLAHSDGEWCKIGSVILPPYTELRTHGLYVMRHKRGTVDFQWISQPFNQHQTLVALSLQRGNPLLLDDFLPDLAALPLVKETYGD